MRVDQLTRSVFVQTNGQVLFSIDRQCYYFWLVLM